MIKNSWNLMVVFVLVSLWFTACSNGNTDDDNWVISPDAPVITQLVVGIMLIDDENGLPEKTTFKVGDTFMFGFRASDPNGDWDKMILKAIFKETGQIIELSISLEDFLGYTSIGTNRGDTLGTPGTIAMSWQITDRAGNKSNVIEREITVSQ